MEEFFRQKAEENLKLAGKMYGENHTKSSEPLPILANPLKPEINKVNTREEISKVAGISHGNIDKIKEIKSSAPVEVLSH